ncbi:hypothetical protein Tco_0844953 [Tanacetum coccineum]
MVASESGSPLQPPQAHPGAAFPRLLLHPRMRNLGKTISWRLCGITSISAFLFSNVDDVLTYVEGWQRVTIGRLSNLHRRTLRKLAMYSCDLDTFIAHVISSASSKVVAAFAERREEKISVPVVMQKQVFGLTYSIHVVRGQAKEPNSLQRQTATYIRQALIPLRTSTINGNNVVANRDSRHHNYHVTTSQLSATGHIRRPFARTPSICKKLSYWVPHCNKTCFGMGEVA